jgi:hypothetical protein
MVLTFEGMKEKDRKKEKEGRVRERKKEKQEVGKKYAFGKYSS